MNSDYAYAYKLSTEQYNKLLSFTNEEWLDSFLFTVSMKYGAGEVMSYEHMLDIFTKKYSEAGEIGWLTMYVDTIRMLKLAEKDATLIFEPKNIEELIKLHDELSKNFSIDKMLVPLYLKAVKPFLKLSQSVSGQGYNTRFELIKTVDELQHEGDSMEHCIASYANYVASGNYIAFRVFEDDTNGRFTLGLHREGSELLFDQLKGTRNHPASVPACQATLEFCNKNGISVAVEHNNDLFPIKETK